MPDRSATVLPSIFSVLLALLICFVAISLTRSVPVAGEAYLQMLFGGIGDWPMLFDGGRIAVVTRPLGEGAMKAALLILTGLSVAVAFRVGLFNIGAQGQMMFGALAAAVVGAQVSLPPVLHWLVAVLAAAICGGLYAAIPAVLKLSRGVHEVISTIMLNWVAVSLVENWLIVGPLRAVSAGGTSISGTDQIHATAELPRLLGNISRLNFGFVIALVCAVVVWMWLARTRMGFETRAVGLGMEAARTAGIDVRWRMMEAMIASGALAGLAGAVLVLGTEFKYPATLGAPYGFDGIAISLIGANHPFGVVASALFFGVLRAGGTRMQLLGVHKSFPELIQGLALLFVAGRMVWLALLSKKKGKSVMPVAPVTPEAPRV